MGKRLTQNDFIIKSNIKHNNKYDYSDFEYIDYFTTGKIKCPIHGEFTQIAGYHLEGNGCQECGETTKINRDSFIKKANIKHNNKYCYILTIYKNINTKIKIICEKHNLMFSLSPKYHLAGTGCPDCGKENISNAQKLTQKEFIKLANIKHNYIYNYINSIYIGCFDKIRIDCFKHNDFYQTPTSHLNGSGCPKCANEKTANKQKLTIDNFIKKSIKIHGNKYNYKKFIYVNCHTKGIIVCNNCGDFEQTPSNHLSGKGCWTCNRAQTNEKIIYNLLKYNLINFYHNYDIRKIKSKKRFYVDFYLPVYNIIIEYNGEQHYHPTQFGSKDKENIYIRFDKQQIRDKYVEDFCIENNIKLISIDGRKYKYNKLIKYVNNLIKEINK